MIPEFNIEFLICTFNAELESVSVFVVVVAGFSKKKKSYLLSCWEQVWLVFEGSENSLTKELPSTFACG